MKCFGLALLVVLGAVAPVFAEGTCDKPNDRAYDGREQKPTPAPTPTPSPAPTSSDWTSADKSLSVADGEMSVRSAVDSISIAKDVDSITCKGDFNSSAIGYYTYAGDRSDVDVEKAIAEQAKAGASLAKDDKVGFYLKSGNGYVTNFHLQKGADGHEYLVFTKGWGFSTRIYTFDFKDLSFNGISGSGGDVRGTPLPSGIVAAALTLIVGGAVTLRRRAGEC